MQRMTLLLLTFVIKQGKGDILYSNVVIETLLRSKVVGISKDSDIKGYFETAHKINLDDLEMT